MQPSPTHNSTPSPKDALRAPYLQRRREVPEDERQAAGRSAGALFDAFKPFRKHKTYCAYLSNDHELPTRYFLRKVFAWNAALGVPAWDDVDKTYRLFAFHAQMKVVKGRFGLREPEHRFPVEPAGVSLFLIPGVVFDAHGNRVGHGKGYYDHILKHASPDALKVGVCYDWQISPDPLPAEAHDIPMDFLLTDRRVVCCNPARLVP